MSGNNQQSTPENHTKTPDQQHPQNHLVKRPTEPGYRPKSLIIIPQLPMHAATLKAEDLNVLPKRTRFKGLAPTDGKLLRAWLDTFDHPLAFWTGVLCGVIREDPPLPPRGGGLIDDMINAYALRCDLVGLTHNTYTIAEIKPDAGHEALGQVLAYTHAIKAGLPDGMPTISVIITDWAQHYMHPLCHAHNVRIDELGPYIGYA